MILILKKAKETRYIAYKTFVKRNEIIIVERKNNENSVLFLKKFIAILKNKYLKKYKANYDLLIESMM